MSSRDHHLAKVIEAHGGQWGERVILEARSAGIPISLGCALLTQESGFANVFGHDPTIYVGAGTVTKAKYLAYRRKRGSHGQGGMQGVGPCQLTYYSIQDQADALGGCWVPAHNIHVGFHALAAHIVAYGYAAGIKAYNGTGPAADAYSRSVRNLASLWHRRLS